MPYKPNPDELPGEMSISETGEVIQPSKKRVSRDGTQRGLHRAGQKNRVQVLTEQIKHAVEQDSGISNWDPIVQMSVIAVRAFTGYAARDEKGNPIKDPESGEPVMIPPDLELALRASSKVAPYLHQNLRPREVGEDEKKVDPEERKQQILAAIQNMGVPRKALEVKSDSQSES